VLLPMFRAAGLRIGEDIFLGVLPERIDPGNSIFIVGYPQGGRRRPARPHPPRAALTAQSSPSRGLVAEKSPARKRLRNVFRTSTSGVERVRPSAAREVRTKEVIDAAATKPLA